MDFDLDLDHLLSPVKKPTAPLPPLNDLFQVTNNNLFNIDIAHDSPNHKLKNNKIEKLLKDLERDDNEYDLDSQGRSRIFKGRIHDLELADDKICSYLDQENNMDPVKCPRSPSKSPIRRVKKPLKPVKALNTIPVLKSKDIHKGFEEKVKKDTKRVCKPKHRVEKPSKSCLAAKRLHTYIVDSSTGLLNDATQFGTELNQSNCEGFPLPDENEVVQIPTHDGEDPERMKMAIIRAVNSHTSQEGGQNTVQKGHRKGFYNKSQLTAYLDAAGVEVVGQTWEQKNGHKQVRFADADDIEW